jgi:hypothetical protein
MPSKRVKLDVSQYIDIEATERDDDISSAYGSDVGEWLIVTYPISNHHGYYLDFIDDVEDIIDDDEAAVSTVSHPIRWNESEDVNSAPDTLQEIALEIQNRYRNVAKSDRGLDAHDSRQFDRIINQPSLRDAAIWRVRVKV